MTLVYARDVLGLAIGVCALVGLAVKYLLLPYMKAQIEAPLQQIKKQVTENHHSNREPTVLDLISDVHTDVKDLGSKFDGHLSWSHEETNRLWSAIADIKKDR